MAKTAPKRGKARSHKVTITVRVDRPITRRQAIYAAWNAIHDYELWGMGKDHPSEPFDQGKITVPQR